MIIKKTMNISTTLWQKLSSHFFIFIDKQISHQDTKAQKNDMNVEKI